MHEVHNFEHDMIIQGKKIKISTRYAEQTHDTSLAAKPGYISTPNCSAFPPNQRTN